MVVFFNDGTFETTLPDVAERAVLLMKAPGVRHRQGLKNAADALPFPWLENQVEMITHQAIAKKPEGIALLGLRERVEKGLEVVGSGENDVAIVATVKCVVNEAVS